MTGVSNALQASAIPSMTSENAHITSGRSGEAKFRQLVIAIGCAPDADDVARGLGNHQFRTFTGIRRAVPAIAIQ